MNLGGRVDDLTDSFHDCLAKARAYEEYEPDDSVDQELYEAGAAPLKSELRKSTLQLVDDAQHLIARIDGNG